MPWTCRMATDTAESASASCILRLGYRRPADRRGCGAFSLASIMPDGAGRMQLRASRSVAWEQECCVMEPQKTPTAPDAGCKVPVWEQGLVQGT